MIGFDDGIYDLKTDKFRKALKTEYVSCSVGYSYKQASEDCINKLKKIFTDIYPNKKQRTYVLTVLSFGLVHQNFLQEFYMFIGNGGNGKSIMRHLVESTLGSSESGGYCGTIPYTFYTSDGKNNTNAMYSCFAQNIYSRIIFVDEPKNGGSKLEIDLIKKISGGDKILAKLFYKDPQNIYPQYHQIFISNNLLDIPIEDDSIPRRARCVPHKQKFVRQKDYNPKDPSHIIADPSIEFDVKNNIEYRYAFFEILKKHYYKFEQNNRELIIPEEFQKETQDWVTNNDPIGSFINQCIDVTYKSNNVIKSSAMYKAYIGNNNEAISQKLFKEYFRKKGILTKKGSTIDYLGVKFKSAEILINVMQHDTINYLIEQKLVIGEKIETTESEND